MLAPPLTLPHAQPSMHGHAQRRKSRMLVISSHQCASSPAGDPMHTLPSQRKLSSRSDRVKNVDIHPVEPWVLSAMYNGHAFLWNYATQSLVKSFEVSDQPVRAAKFIPRKQWIVCGADDMQLRVYNYNTMEKVKTFEGHSDYIRCARPPPAVPPRSAPPALRRPRHPLTRKPSPGLHSATRCAGASPSTPLSHCCSHVRMT